MDIRDLDTDNSRDKNPPAWLIVVLLALIPILFWLDVKWKVEGSPYHCSSLAEADKYGAVLDRISTPVQINLRGVNTDAEIWTEHEYRYIRTGLFTASTVADGDVYINMAFVGNAMMREHMRSVVSFYIDNQLAELIFTSHGSLLRTPAKGLAGEHTFEIRDGDTVLRRTLFSFKG